MGIYFMSVKQNIINKKIAQVWVALAYLVFCISSSVTKINHFITVKITFGKPYLRIFTNFEIKDFESKLELSDMGSK